MLRREENAKNDGLFGVGKLFERLRTNGIESAL